MALKNFKIIATWDAIKRVYVDVTVKEGRKTVFYYQTPHQKAWVRKMAGAYILGFAKGMGLKSYVINYTTVDPSGKVMIPRRHDVLKKETVTIKNGMAVSGI